MPCRLEKSRAERRPQGGARPPARKKRSPWTHGGDWPQSTQRHREEGRGARWGAWPAMESQEGPRRSASLPRTPAPLAWRTCAFALLRHAPPAANQVRGSFEPDEFRAAGCPGSISDSVPRAAEGCRVPMPAVVVRPRSRMVERQVGRATRRPCCVVVVCGGGAHVGVALSPVA